MKVTKILGLTLASMLVLTACKKKNKEETVTEQTAIETSEVETKEPEIKPNSAKTSIDWKGEYFGVLPCADCPGLETTITLNEDGTFKKVEEAQEGDLVDEFTGKFEWSEDGTKIKIAKDTYLIGEGQIVMLDKQGNLVVGELADKYVLKKK